MTKRDFATLACKLLGVYFFIQSIYAVLTVISIILSSFATAFREQFGWFDLFLDGSYLITAAISVGIGLFLWFKAQQCAASIFPEDSPPARLAADKNLMPIALSVTGVIILAVAFPHLLSQIISHLQSSDALGHLSSDQMMQNRIDGWASLFQVLIGIWLVLGAGHISRMIKVVNHFIRDTEA